MKKVRKVKKNKNFYKILSFILILCSVISFGIILYFDVLPNRYLILSCIVLGALVLFLVYKFNVKTKNITKILCLLLSIILIFVEVLGTIYAFGTIEFFNNIVDTGYHNETYGVYIINDYNNLKELNNKILGVKKDDDHITKALNKLNYKLKYQLKEYDSITDLVKALNAKEIDALYINEALMNIYLEEHDDNIKELSTFDIIVKTDSEFKNVNVTKKPFVIYISGVDTSGKVNSSARSDVNILAFVNPVNGKILLVNTPRDYYLELYSKKAKDKLTHAGLYGTSESAKTLELLYGTEVNYYVRVNFTSFIKIIDDLGGITVDVETPDYRFNGKNDCGAGYICEQNSKRSWENAIYIKAGKNIKLNGEQALAYARNRHQYADGDIARGRHQEEIIKATIEKIVSPSIITKYNSILKDLSKGIITNIDQKTITKLINFELDTNKKWDIEMISNNGTNGFDVCYSLGKYKAFVLVPDEEKLTEIKEKIKEIME